MKKIFISAALFIVTLSAAKAQGAVPVISANGFVCGKEGVTVTCKGSLPDGKGSITGTGHDLVYLTINMYQQGTPTRYTYFSDTGCLIGYTFGANGQPVAAVASDRNGNKQNFSFESGKYDEIAQFCLQEKPKS